jgi:ribosome-associated protein
MSLATEAASDTSTRVKNAVAAALDKKAENVRVLCLRPVSDFADYFLICTGTNDRQVQAIADAVQDALRAEGVRPLHVEGERVGAWVLVDYGDLVVHVFQPEPRGFYGLERLWSDAPDETAQFVA